jgi:hypothetical protein
MNGGVKSEIDIDTEDQRIGGGFSTLSEIKEARPDFLKEEFIKDKMGKRPGDKLYDETNLWIPSDVWKSFTPAMK